MKKTVLGIALAVLTLVPLTSRAVSLESALSIDVTVYTQVPAVTRGNQEIKRISPVHLTNRDIIAALSTATGQDLTGGKLLLVRDNFGINSTNSSSNDSRFVVRKGTNDTDVSAYFNPQDSNKVESSVFQITKNAYLEFSRTSDLSFTFSAGNLSLSLSGLVTQTGRTVTHGHGDMAVSGKSTVIRATLAGTVTRGDVTGPAQGTLMTSPGIFR